MGHFDDVMCPKCRALDWDKNHRCVKPPEQPRGTDAPDDVYAKPPESAGPVPEGANPPADVYAKLRRFIDNPPKNAALVYATGWHVVAAELMKRMMAVVDASAETIEAARGADPYTGHGAEEADAAFAKYNDAVNVLQSAVNKEKRDG